MLFYIIRKKLANIPVQKMFMHLIIKSKEHSKNVQYHAICKRSLCRKGDMLQMHVCQKISTPMQAICISFPIQATTRMLANSERDGRPA